MIPYLLAKGECEVVVAATTSYSKKFTCLNVSTAWLDPDRGVYSFFSHQVHNVSTILNREIAWEKLGKFSKSIMLAPVRLKNFQVSSVSTIHLETRISRQWVEIEVIYCIK